VLIISDKTIDYLIGDLSSPITAIYAETNKADMVNALKELKHLRQENKTLKRILKEGYYESFCETQIVGPPRFRYTCKICGNEWYEDEAEKHFISCIILKD